MIKPSYVELLTCLRSLSCMKNVIARPVVVCKECRRQLSFVKKSRTQHIFIANSSTNVSNCFLKSGLPVPVYSWKQQKGTWYNCWTRHLSTIDDQNLEAPISKQKTSPKASAKTSDKIVATDAESVHLADKMVASGAESLPPAAAQTPNMVLTSASASETAASSSPSEADAAEKKKNKLLRVTPRMRKPNPIDYSYTGNIYILPQRALAEYLLEPNDLQDLPKYSRRSPYAEGTRITLYLRSDVEEVALNKWGSFDRLNKEKAKLRNVESSGRHDIMDLRSLLGGEAHISGDYVNPDDPQMPSTSGNVGLPNQEDKEPTFWSTGSTRVVLSAILVNGANSLFKLIAWLYTGSHSMFSEFIHSCADTMNQIILAIGLYHSFKKPDTDHPYGYRNLRNISSLISGVGIFFFGTGLSYYHSLQGFLHPQDLGNLHWCIATLIGSFISEGATLIIAVNQVRKSAKAGEMGFIEYLMRGIDPNVNVVLLEDCAAVLGVGIAGICISVSALTGSSFADALGSALIGTLLGSVAAFIVHQNTLQLVGRSIPLDERQDISQLLETDRMIRSLHDIKATQMGGIVRFKAEVDFDGREITRAYLYKQDLDLLLLEAQNLKSVEELESFMLNHGEKIIDGLGAEVDRIEKILKAKHPEIRHVDLEAL